RRFRIVPRGIHRIHGATCELTATVARLVTLPLPVPRPPLLNIGLRRLVLIPVDELPAVVSVPLVFLPHPGTHEGLRVVLIAAPFLDGVGGHEPVRHLVHGPGPGKRPYSDSGLTLRPG